MSNQYYKNNNNSNFTSRQSRGAFEMEKKDQDVEPKKQILAGLESPTSPAYYVAKNTEKQPVMAEKVGKAMTEPIQKDIGNGARGNGAKDLQGWSLSKMPQPFGWPTSASSLDGPMRSPQLFSDPDDVIKMIPEQMDNKSPEGACPSHGQEGIAMEPPHGILAPNDVISLMETTLKQWDEKTPAGSFSPHQTSNGTILEPTNKLEVDIHTNLKFQEAVLSPNIDFGKHCLGKKVEGSKLKIYEDDVIQHTMGFGNSEALNKATSSEKNLALLSFGSRHRASNSSTSNILQADSKDRTVVQNLKKFKKKHGKPGNGSPIVLKSSEESQNVKSTPSSVNSNFNSLRQTLTSSCEDQTTSPLRIGQDQDSEVDVTSESKSKDKKSRRRHRGSKGSRSQLEHHLEPMNLEDGVANSEESGASFNDVFKKLPEESVSESSFQKTSHSDVASPGSSTDSDSERLLESKKCLQKLSFGGPGTLVYVNKMKTTRINNMKRRKRGDNQFKDQVKKSMKSMKKNFVLNSQKVVIKVYEIQNPWDSGENNVKYSQGPKSPVFAFLSSEDGAFRSPNKELEALKTYFKAFESGSSINSMESCKDDDDGDDVFYESDEGALSDALGNISISEDSGNSEIVGPSELTDGSSDVSRITSALESRAKRTYPGLPLLQAIGIYSNQQVARIARVMEPKKIYEEQRLDMEEFEKDHPLGPPFDEYAGGPISPAFGQMGHALSPIGLDADGGGGFGGSEDGPEQD